MVRLAPRPARRLCGLPAATVITGPPLAVGVGLGCWWAGLAGWQAGLVGFALPNVVLVAATIGLARSTATRRSRSDTGAAFPRTAASRFADDSCVDCCTDVGSADWSALVRARTEEVLRHRAVAIAMQPMVDLLSGVWTCAEALARFADGRPPDVWIEEAHAVGLGNDLELLAIETACRAAAEIPEHIRVALNVSPQILLDPRLVETLVMSGVDFERVLLEVTEHDPVPDYIRIQSTLPPLRSSGVRLAVDDVGAGYASLAHVLELRPDVIKLDRALTMRIEDDAACRAFVTGVILLAYELGARVVAEGVETAGQLATFDGLGADWVQGYLMAKPTTNVDVWGGWATQVWDIRAMHRDPYVIASRSGALRIASPAHV